MNLGPSFDPPRQRGGWFGNVNPDPESNGKTANHLWMGEQGRMDMYGVDRLGHEPHEKSLYTSDDGPGLCQNVWSRQSEADKTLKQNDPEYYQSADYLPEIKNRAIIFSCLGDKEEKVLTPSERMHLISLVHFLRLNDPEYLSASPQKVNEKPDTGVGSGNTQLRVEVEKILLVPPQHYAKSVDLRVDTESQVFEAFESALTEWRWGNSGDPSREELNDVTDATSRLIDDVGKEPIKVYAWRASPTLNWKLNGECAPKEYFQSYSDASGDNVIYTYEEGGESDEDVNHAQIPYPNIAINISPRLEVIMLAYRYACIVINRSCREFNTPRFGEGVGGLQSIPGIYTKIDILVSQQDNIRSNLKDLMRVYFIMQSLVSPMLGGWVTLDKPIQIAELTQDCCRFIQYLVYAIRLQYCVRLQRIHYELEEERGLPLSVVKKNEKHQQIGGVRGLGNPEMFREKDSEEMLYGQHIGRWAKLYMGIAMTLLDAIEIYNGPMSLVHGDLACPEYIKCECHDPQESIVVERLRSYMTDLCFLYLTKSLNFYAIFAETKVHQLDDGDGLVVGPGGLGGKQKKRKSKDEDAEKYRNMAVTMAQIGLSCTRVMIVTNGPDVKYAKLAEERFNMIIQEMYPKITRLCTGLMGGWELSSDDGGSDFESSDCKDAENVNMGMLDDYRRRQEVQSQGSFNTSGPSSEMDGNTRGRKEFRICNKRGLLVYMTEVSDFFTYDNCDFLLDLFEQDTGVPKEWDNYMYFYRPAKRTGKISNHLTRSGIYLKAKAPALNVKLKEDYDISGKKINRPGSEAGDKSSRLSSKEIWKRMVSEQSKYNK